MKPTKPFKYRASSLSRNGQSGYIIMGATVIVLALSAFGMLMMKDMSSALSSAQSLKQKTRAFYASDGIMSILCQEIVDENGLQYLSQSNEPTGSISLEVWDNLDGDQVSDLIASANFPDNPDTAFDTTYFGFNWKYHKGNYWGTRMRGYIHPPVTGSYTFYLCASADGELWLSTDDTEANKSKIIGPTGICESWTDDKYFHSSSAVNLTGGQKYYIEALQKKHKQWNLGNLLVGWSGPSNIEEYPIGGDRLSPYRDFTTDSIWTVGDLSVKYKVARNTEGEYIVNTDAYMEKGSGGKMYSAPLNQVFSPGSFDETPELAWLKVIFYDFIPGTNTGGNANFEARRDWRRSYERCSDHMSGVPNTDLGAGRWDVIEDTLDADRKPVRSGIGDGYCEDRLSYEWFRPSGNSTTSPDPSCSFYFDLTDSSWKWSNLVNYKGRAHEWVSPTFDETYDFANIVIYDSLPFTLREDLGTKMYQFSRLGIESDASVDEDPFFWLDNRGFGNEPYIATGNFCIDLGWTTQCEGGTYHNYSFTMEIHEKFTYEPGLTFEFNGDDDCWVFINDSLVIDLGGWHVNLADTINLDDLPGMIPGNKYNFDFFYAERRTNASRCRITTNMDIFSYSRFKSSWQRDYGTLD